MAKRELWELKSMQAAPLPVKVLLTKTRIREWINEFGEDGVYVSFSGGKDSTVLLDIVRQDYPNVPAVFCDTGLEYPEIREFVKTFDNVTWLKPELTFKQTIEKCGYPFVTKEVAECVYGARRYIESVIGDDQKIEDIGADLIAILDKESLKELSGGARRLKNSHRDIVSFAQSANSIRGREEVNQLIDNFRVQRLLGILPKTGKATVENIPKWTDRSKYACEKYQFFLKAPFEIGQRCCRVMKKSPFQKYERATKRKPFTAQMAEESRLRQQSWLQSGCNAFDNTHPKSNPMMFWTEQDVLRYIYENKIPIAPVYGTVTRDTEVTGQLSLFDYDVLDEESNKFKTTGCKRTGCVFCGFGCHLEKGESRFELLKKTHPKLYDYVMRPKEEGGLDYKRIIDWINENGSIHIRY